LGFAIQVLYGVVPSSSEPQLRADHRVVVDGKILNLSPDDINKILLSVRDDTPAEKTIESGGSLPVARIQETASGMSTLSTPTPHTEAKQQIPRIDYDNTVPNIVNAWRSAKLDWHKLLPQHNSLWERFGTPQGEGKLNRLVNKETLVTDYLTRFHESGLSAQFGHNHGPLQPYSGCNALRSSCMIHNEAQCGLDQLCAWATEKLLCVDAWDLEESEGQGDVAGDRHTRKQQQGTKPATCTSPKIVGDRGFQRATEAQCVQWVTDPAVLVSVDSESQSMFYHWWASWTGVVDFWRNVLNSSRRTHFFLRQINDPMFFTFFGLLSDNCWRRIGKAYNLPSVCYCNTHTFGASQGRVKAAQGAQQMLEYLGLSDTKQPEKRVKIGLISRRRKRFILNEYELVQKVQAMGFDCVLLPLEVMTLYEQMEQLRSLDVLVGIHGSALDNAVFLHPGAVMVQLLPYRVEHRVTFRDTALAAGVVYQEWQLQDPSKAVFHWDLLDQANEQALSTMSRQQYLDRGQEGADSRETLMFWINQVRTMGFLLFTALCYK
jgi:hypothetical protein